MAGCEANEADVARRPLGEYVVIYFLKWIAS
jgi:hypothetical protein